MPKRAEPGYAIIRLDEFLGEDVALQSKVTIKRIVWNLELAEAEVDRLNKLNEEKGCHYFWQYTRVDPKE